MEETPFVHLHAHSEFSLRDGTTPVAKLVNKAKELGHTHVALTDHAVMFAAVEFYVQAKKAGIIPIVGCEINFEGLPTTLQLAKELEVSAPQLGAFHFVLLAKDTTGYKNLIKVVSNGYTEDYQETPTVSKEFLEENTDQLVGLSSTSLGELAFLIGLHRRFSPTGKLPLQAEGDEAGKINQGLKAYFDFFKKVLGPQDFYIELIDNHLPGQKELIEDLVQVAEFYQVPLVATCDSHYLNKEDVDTHALATAIRNKLTQTDIRGRLRDAQFHVPDNEEFLATYGTWPEAIANTKKIAEKCSGLEIEMDKFYLPVFELDTGESSDEALVRLSKEGLEQRFIAIEKTRGTPLTNDEKKVYYQRLDFELKVILDMKFPGYFLIVQDFINWAKENGIPVGPGRGSGAGSLVAFALRITNLDPLPYNLIFERFLNPDRISMPDFDVDFCQWRRDEVIQYVTEKYGFNQVAQIITFGKMMAKGAVKNVGRAMNMGFNKVDRFTKLFPEELNISLQDALDMEPKLSEEMDKDETLKEMMDYAFKLEGLASHTSVHAAGVVISDGPMVNYVPTYVAEPGGPLITQYEMKKAEKVGLVKFDFLGLKTLTVINEAVKLIHKSLDPQFDIDLIPIDDQKVYDFISSGKTVGLFQLESSGMTNLVLKLKPSCFEDVVALVALFRPGPLGSGMVDDFVERKHGRQEISYPHPDLEPILKDTYGMILYQEQVQKIAAVLANYTLGEADLLRRAMGKKIAEEMAKQKDRFVSGALENDISKDLAEEIFDLMAEFANYGFNKSHSAAYGLVSYQTAYLKTKYPEQFMAAIMTCDLDNTSKIIRYMEDCRAAKIKVNAPDINSSEIEFDVAIDKSIVYGLSAIKGMGAVALEPLLEDRKENGPYKDLTDLCLRVNLNKVGKKTLELLTQVGALDCFGYPRKHLMGLIKEAVIFSSQHHEANSSGQHSLFDMMEETQVEESVSGAPWEGAPVPPLKKGRTWDFDDLIQERKLLGVFLSGHPMELFETDYKFMRSAAISNFPKLAQSESRKGTPVTLVALLSNFNERRTKTGSLMASFKLEQADYASFEGVMFEKTLENTQVPPLDTPVLVHGNVGLSFDGSMLRFNLDQIKPLEEVRGERIKGLSIGLKTKETPGNVTSSIEGLKNIIAQNKGHTPIRFVVELDETKVVIGGLSSKVELTNDLLFGLDGIEAFDIKTEFHL